MTPLYQRPTNYIRVLWIFERFHSSMLISGLPMNMNPEPHVISDQMFDRFIRVFSIHIRKLSSPGCLDSKGDVLRTTLCPLCIQKNGALPEFHVSACDRVHFDKFLGTTSHGHQEEEPLIIKIII
ncbi:hypothetical protein RF11_01314 [Thelohanellus kitauei]|uniref:Uncharacterized protein n=1 Tax=Thelohanellus kitauei TaxID=669202 RepID=A0A0C2JD00_THEKT|nr:hypothetical protein RF11_01314 [Thelohanellus kitauei]